MISGAGALAPTTRDIRLPQSCGPTELQFREREAIGPSELWVISP